MKKLAITFILIAVTLTACVSTTNEPAVSNDPTDQIVQSLEATIEVLVEEVEEAAVEEAEEIVEVNENIDIVEAEEENSSETPCLVCDYDFSTYSGSLSELETQGLLLALNDEYRAWAIYDQVLIDHGTETRPFSNIIRSEAQHYIKLIDLFNEFNVAIPENVWIGNVPSFDSVSDACAAGVGAEIENVALYDELFESTDREEIIIVYDALQRASLDKHLPAFSSCGSDQ